MINDITQIAGFPEVMEQISAVSSIFDLNQSNEFKFCFTITFQQDRFVNVFQPYISSDKADRFADISNLQKSLMEYLEELSISKINKVYSN